MPCILISDVTLLHFVHDHPANYISYKPFFLLQCSCVQTKLWGDRDVCWDGHETLKGKSTIFTHQSLYTSLKWKEVVGTKKAPQEIWWIASSQHWLDLRTTALTRKIYSYNIKDNSSGYAALIVVFIFVSAHLELNLHFINISVPKLFHRTALVAINIHCGISSHFQHGVIIVGWKTYQIHKSD